MRQLGGLDLPHNKRYNDLEIELQDLRTRLDDQFEKLNAMIKANSPKKGLELLKTAGFDMTEIEVRFATPKNEIMTLEVDNDLLSLPETPKVVVVVDDIAVIKNES